MAEPILLIMAAGMGSRYGGLKQIDPVGAHGEVILDYSLYDAYRAGFRRAVIVIKPENEADFRQVLGEKVSGYLEVRYAYQTHETALPQGFQIPEGRKKPWGTGHAVLSASELVDAPFCAINADDYYGREAFRLAYQHLKAMKEDSDYCMVGYLLKNTLSENGSVARGVCSVDEAQKLKSLVERTHIISTVDGPLMTEDGTHYERLSPETVVSMNMWGFPQSMMAHLQEGFLRFLENTLPQNPLKAEYFLPFQVNDDLADGLAQVTVYTTPDRWCGVTYRAEHQLVADAMREMAERGEYPSPLWQEKQA